LVLRVVVVMLDETRLVGVPMTMATMVIMLVFI
jgi:hypothetical protein